MATIGLDKLYYAKITESEDGEETYGLPAQLAKAGEDPLGAWRAGDPEQVSALAALELRRLGLRAAPVSRL